MPKLNPIAFSLLCAACVGGCAAPLNQQAHEVPARPAVGTAKPPVTAEGVYRLGRYFEGQARYERAIAAYRHALKLDPRFVEAYTGLGTALAAQGRHDEAVHEFQAAAVLAPNAAQVHNDLGYAYLQSGAYHEALEALERARRLDPQHQKAKDNLRLAQAKLAPKLPTDATARLILVEVAPQVFELRAAAHYRKIETQPLPRAFKLEISNGNGIGGMARRVAGHLAAAGLRTARLTNQRPFTQARTEVLYRDGYAAEAADLAARLPQPVRLVAGGDIAQGVDVRLVLGKDLPLQALKRSSRRSRA